MRDHPPFGPLSQRRLNPVKPVYDPDWPDGLLDLTASAFNQLGQYTSSPDRRGYCYAELAVFFHNAYPQRDGQAELHPTTNWAQCRATALIKTNVLSLHQTTT